jgi:hypothetical protein
VANTVYVADGEYIFEMTDSYGDGLCCGYGEGGFEIFVNDVKVENSITFDFRYNADLSFEVVGNIETPASFDGGGYNGDPGGGCENKVERYLSPNSGGGTYTGSNEVVVEFRYDDKPIETRWRSKGEDGTFISGTCLGFFSQPGVVVRRTVYLKAGSLYQLTIWDPDGICCGNGEGGGFSITVNGEPIAMESTPEFTSRTEEWFSFSDPARRLDVPLRRLEDDIPILEVAGVALLAFGRRRLRAPIRGRLSDGAKAFMAAQQQENYGKEIVVASSARRMLQEGAAESGFGLQVNLKDEIASDSDSQGTGSGSQMAAALLVLTVLAAGCGLGFSFFTKEARKQDKEEDIVKHHSSAASGYTYASQCSANSSNYYEYPSCSGRGRIT